MSSFARAFADSFRRTFAASGLGKSGESLGPELAADIKGLGWTMSGTTPPTEDANGVTFTSASNLAAAAINTPALKNDTTYEIVITADQYTSGTFRLLVYGDTANHLGVGATRSAAGTYTERVTTSATGSNNNELRVQATGTSGTNTYRISFVSCKEVIPG